MTSSIYKLKDDFIKKYSQKDPGFGFNGLGELVYLRTYSRVKPDGNNEEWFETIRRVVEGIYTIQKRHIIKYNLGWSEDTAHESAEEMYDRMFHMKFLPPGRGLWACGTDLTNVKGLFAALNNCAFVSTNNLDVDLSKPFEFMMDMSMLGVGVGFDTLGAGKLTISKPLDGDFIYEIGDTREEWVKSLKMLINAYFKGDILPKFDYSAIRKEGELIKTFGGKSSGPAPLIQLHNDIINLLNDRIGKEITSSDIVDIMNYVGRCVVSGNVRRTAQIAFGSPDDKEYLKLKDYYYEEGVYRGSMAHRSSYGWCSNNSVLCDIGMSYGDLARQTVVNGEPGYFWLDNAKAYGRLADPINFKDNKAMGCNPCFTYDTPILTVDGYMPIGLLARLGEGDFDFINKDGEKVSGKVWYSGDKEVIHLIYNKNKIGYIIKCTPNHVFMLNDESEIEAKDTKGKKLMPFYKIKDLSLSNSKIVSLGFVQGDGRTNPAKRQKTVTAIFGKKDYDVEKYFDKTLTYDLLEEYGFDKNKLPKRDLPKIFKEWSIEEKCDFLTGLYSANGCVLKKSKRIVLKSTNYNLVLEIKNFLEKINIDSYITVNKKKITKFYNGEYLCKESYDLNIANFDSIVSFASNIGFIQDYKRKLLKKAILDKSPTIQHIVKGEIERVYDFSLNDNKHWGVVDGFIAHNCGEQTLESYEMCCLVEVFPTRHETKEDFLRTLKFAYLYAKSVTLGNTHWVETNRVMLRNRRIGTSISGIAQFIDSKGIDNLIDWLSKGYDVIQHYDSIYSDWLAIPKSIKTTSIKPSGTVSLLPGVTPGMHYPESNYYIRRVRIAKNSDLLDKCIKAGYKYEESVSDNSSYVVEIPVEIKGVRTISQVSMWEQLLLAELLQKYWSDNQVSCTITFKPDEAKDIPYALNYFQYKLKAVSFLPKTEIGKYAQMPYEEITKDEYNELIKTIKPLELNNIQEDSKPEMYCDSDSCTIL